jgi:hypothetical protein
MNATQIIITTNDIRRSCPIMYNIDQMSSICFHRTLIKKRAKKVINVYAMNCGADIEIIFSDESD